MKLLIGFLVFLFVFQTLLACPACDAQAEEVQDDLPEQIPENLKIDPSISEIDSDAFSDSHVSLINFFAHICLCIFRWLKTLNYEDLHGLRNSNFNSKLCINDLFFVLL